MNFAGSLNHGINKIMFTFTNNILWGFGMSLFLFFLGLGLRTAFDAIFEPADIKEDEKDESF